MKIKLTKKAERGIGLRSMSTGKLTRYEAGDELEVVDSIATGLINSGLAEVVEEEQTAPDGEQTTEPDATPVNDGKPDDEQTAETLYTDMTKEELIALCKEKGITSGGTKVEIIARLTEE